MKNKGIIGSIIALAVILIGVFAYQMGSRQNANTETDENSKDMQTVGILQFISHPSLDQISDGVIEGLKQEGFVEGENINIEFLNGQGDQSKLNTMTQQLLNKDSDVLVGVATPAAKALANGTSEIPVIMGAISDPIGADLVESLEKPGGNVTGVNNLAPVGQQFELIKALFPEAKKIALLYSSSEENSQAQIDNAEKMAQEQGYEATRYAVSSSNEIAQLAQSAAAENDFIYVPQDNIIANAFQTVINESDKTQTPVFVSVDNMVTEGGIATIGQNQFDLGVETGKMAADVLKGNTDAGNTPVNVIDYGEMIINEKKAAELGITIPEDIKKEATMVEGE
ncbi:tryptophan ABC transporter substrate-binding protein [Enterococcus sp. AZ109]|uniref:tryptophan ABC transporter substrate-binding protein n=1 Tax=Enterococcus sp. AZ109 TaxID=2774634 RepID=UPI003F21485F